MGALNTTTTNPSVVSNYWDRRLLERALAKVVHGRVADRRPLARRNGKVMTFRRYENLALTGQVLAPLVEGQPPSGQSVSHTDINVTIQQWGNFILSTDMVQMTTDHPVLEEWNELLGEQAVRVIEILLRDVANAGTNVMYGGGVAARSNLVGTAQKVSASLLDRMTLNLLESNATMFNEMIKASVNISTFPIRESFIGITSERVAYTLDKLPGWISTEEYSRTDNTMQYERGSYRNIRFLVSTLAKTFPLGGGTHDGSDVLPTGGSGSPTDVHTIVLFAKHAIASVPLEGASLQNIIKKLGDSGVADPLDQVGSSGWKHTGARTILNQTFMVRGEVTVADVAP
jgi:N4-gp56 family major capsid protein